MAGILADVHGAAKDAMAAQLNGSVKSAATHSRGLRRDDPKKINHLYVKFDSVDLLQTGRVRGSGPGAACKLDFLLRDGMC